MFVSTTATSGSAPPWRLGLDLADLWRLINGGVLAAFMTSGELRFRRADFERYVEALHG